MKGTSGLLFSCALFIFLVSMKNGGDYAPATFPGGKTAMDNYLIDSLRYPAEEMAVGREEIVRVIFDVSAEGVAQNPQVRSLIGGSTAFEEEAKRLINAMPKWDPELNKRGNPVATSEYTIIRFVLPDSLLERFPLSPDTALYPDFDSIEIMPRFQGGESSFQTYLMWTIRYPQLEKEQGKDGTVYIYFEVNKTGSIENVKCQKGVPGAPGLSREAIRVISQMPRWVPGYMKGKPVKVGMTVPVRFQLQ
jgi:TonB family protein